MLHDTKKVPIFSLVLLLVSLHIFTKVYRTFHHIPGVKVGNKPDEMCANLSVKIR